MYRSKNESPFNGKSSYKVMLKNKVISHLFQLEEHSKTPEEYEV